MDKIESSCSNKDLRAVRDALEVLSGKWKLQILIAVLDGTKRFKEISREIEGISDRMLSKELKELESHQLVKRKLYDSFPPVVEYSATSHTHSLDTVIYALKEWGHLHREKVIGIPSQEK
jgi:DNA-binding HxlR family transcriptional regulator